MYLVATKHHVWVKHTVTPVSLVPDPENDNEVFVIESEADTKAAEEAAVYGCNNCGLPMAGNTDTLCAGEAS